MEDSAGVLESVSEVCANLTEAGPDHGLMFSAGQFRSASTALPRTSLVEPWEHMQGP